VNIFNSLKKKRTWACFFQLSIFPATQDTQLDVENPASHCLVQKENLRKYPPQDTLKNLSYLFSYIIGGIKVSVVQQLRDGELGHQIHIFCYRNAHYFAPNEIASTKRLQETNHRIYHKSILNIQSHQVV